MVYCQTLARQRQGQGSRYPTLLHLVSDLLLVLPIGQTQLEVGLQEAP